MLTTWPLLQGRAAPYREVSHQFPVPPVGKENQGLEAGGAGVGGTLAFQSTVGHFMGNSTLISHSRTLLWFYHRNHKGIYGALNTVNLIVTEKWGRACNNQHKDLVRPSSHVSCPSINSNPNWQLCLPAQISWGWTLARELDKMQICWFESSKDKFFLS